MKTIKELEEFQPMLYIGKDGYYQALKDVLRLIDDGIKCPCIIRLKARIVG